MKNIFGDEMKYRPCISAVVDALYNDFSLSPTPEMKKSKIETWHLALENITDKAIATGYKKVIQEQLKFTPSSGTFLKLCISWQTTNAEIEEKPYISESPEISQKNAKDILSKLIGMDKKC